MKNLDGKKLYLNEKFDEQDKPSLEIYGASGIEIVEKMGTQRTDDIFEALENKKRSAKTIWVQAMGMNGGLARGHQEMFWESVNKIGEQGDLLRENGVKEIVIWDDIDYYGDREIVARIKAVGPNQKYVMGGKGIEPKNNK